MIPEASDYSNDEQHKSHAFSECSIEDVKRRINYLDG